MTIRTTVRFIDDVLVHEQVHAMMPCSFSSIFKLVEIEKGIIRVIMVTMNICFVNILY
jgi:hypothetical protein